IRFHGEVTFEVLTKLQFGGLFSVALDRFAEFFCANVETARGGVPGAVRRRPKRQRFVSRSAA
ncbi:hypothetical protein, partial [Burkholderia multivorans]|uniref:hypothetical protein n=1 Tax=Burkholderia multivorans TaxID=87883 RepID=UPI001C6137E2